MLVKGATSIRLSCFTGMLPLHCGYPITAPMSAMWKEKRKLGPVSLRLMTLQFKDIVTHTQKLKTVKCIFAVYGFKIWCEISKVPFEITHKILVPYTAKYTFYDVLQIYGLMISSSYDFLSLSENAPGMVSIRNETWKIPNRKHNCRMMMMLLLLQCGGITKNT